MIEGFKKRETSFLFLKLKHPVVLTRLYFSPCLTVCSVNDTLDEIFDESGDEEESQDIVNQVLDEIGIEISGKVRKQHLTSVLYL